MTEKIIRIVYGRDGVLLDANNLSDSEFEIVQSAFDDGERDPGTLRGLIHE